GSLRQANGSQSQKLLLETNTTWKGELRARNFLRSEYKRPPWPGLLRTIKGCCKKIRGRSPFFYGFFAPGSFPADAGLAASATVSLALAVPIRPVRSSRTPRRRK